MRLVFSFVFALASLLMPAAHAQPSGQDYVLQSAYNTVVQFNSANSDQIEKLAEYVQTFRNTAARMGGTAGSDRSQAWAQLRSHWADRQVYITAEQQLVSQGWFDVQSKYTFLQDNRTQFILDWPNLKIEAAENAYRQVANAIGQLPDMQEQYARAEDDFAATGTDPNDQRICDVLPFDPSCTGDPQAPAVESKTLAELIPQVTRWLMRLGATLVFVAIVWVAVQFVFGSGDDDRLSNLKQYFIWLVVGVVVISLAFTIVQIVYNFITQ